MKVPLAAAWSAISGVGFALVVFSLSVKIDLPAGFDKRAFEMAFAAARVFAVGAVVPCLQAWTANRLGVPGPWSRYAWDGSLGIGGALAILFTAMTPPAVKTDPFALMMVPLFWAGVPALAWQGADRHRMIWAGTVGLIALVPTLFLTSALMDALRPPVGGLFPLAIVPSAALYGALIGWGAGRTAALQGGAVLN